MSEEAYHARIELLARRKVVLERRRLAAVDKAIALEASAAEPKIVAGHRRQAKRIEKMIVEIEDELESLAATLDRGVAMWVDGEPALPELPELRPIDLADDRPMPEPEPRAPRPATAAGRRRATERRGRRAPLLQVLTTASGRAGRAALASEVRELEDWLDAAGHGERVEIAAVHAHRFADLEPAFEHREPTVVHIVGRSRKPESLFGPIEAAAGSLTLTFLAAEGSVDEAARLAEVVPVTVGTPAKLDRDVRTAFAAILYASLAQGLPIAEAFTRAQTALAAARMTNGEGPRMFARIAANPAKLTVVNRARVAAPADSAGANAGSSEDPSREQHAA